MNIEFENGSVIETLDLGKTEVTSSRPRGYREQLNMYDDSIDVMNMDVRELIDKMIYDKIERLK